MILTGLIAILSFIIVPILVGFNIVKFLKNDNKSNIYNDNYYMVYNYISIV